MKNVTYGSQRFVTPDDVADALLALSATLRGADSGEVVTVPTFDDDHQDSLSLIVAAGIPMTARPAVSTIDEPDVSDLVERLRGASTRGTAEAELESPSPPPIMDVFDPNELA